MKFWKRSGEYGTMDDDGFVPNSIEITKIEYDEFMASILVHPEQVEKQKNANIAAEIIKTYSLEDQIAMLWKLQTGELTIDSPEIVEHMQIVADAKLKYSI